MTFPTRKEWKQIFSEATDWKMMLLWTPLLTAGVTSIAYFSDKVSLEEWGLLALMFWPMVAGLPWLMIVMIGIMVCALSPIGDEYEGQDRNTQDQELS
jgi:hypothetical protein